MTSTFIVENYIVRHLLHLGQTAEEIEEVSGWGMGGQGLRYQKKRFRTWGGGGWRDHADE